MQTEEQSILEVVAQSVLEDKQEQNNTPVENSENDVVETPTETTEETPEPVEEHKVDYNQEVPLVNGEKMTVGQLKDYVQASKKQQADFIERENQVMRKLDEVNMLSQYLNVVPENIRQQAAAEIQEHVKQEFTRMLDVIPQWKDAVEFNKGRDSIYNLAKQYNLEKDVSQVSDHRVIKLLHDFARLNESLATAKELKSAKQTSNSAGKPKPPMTNAEKQQQLINKAKQSKSSNDELAAIASLF